MRAQLAANRAQFYLDFASGPFYSYNRPGAQPSQGVIQNWWRPGNDGQRQGHTTTASRPSRKPTSPKT
jgi:non-heme chloroperoxidase